MNTIQVQITGKSALNYLKNYYNVKTENTFKVVRLTFNKRGKPDCFSICIPKEITGFKADTIADFSAKEGVLSGMFDLTF